MNYYTVYRDEKMVAFGTSEECASKLGLKNVRQFYALISKSRSGIRKHYSIIVEKYDEEEDDDEK